MVIADAKQACYKRFEYFDELKGLLDVNRQEGHALEEGENRAYHVRIEKCIDCFLIVLELMQFIVLGILLLQFLQI